MKAGDILNSNFLSKNTIVGENFVKLDFQNFCFEFFEEKKFSNENFSEFFLPSTSSYFPIVLNTINENYMKVW